MDKNLFENYIKIFLEENQKLNLISKNDEKLLWEKHICDSLAIEKFFEQYKISPIAKTLLDFGTGGGFPSVPITIRYPDLKVTALDSIRKKINAIEEIKSKLQLTNLTTICDRVENISEKYDIITSRAVASMDKLIPYAIPRLKPEGFFIAYKSVKAKEELDNAKKAMEKYKAKLIDIIEYDLPLEENHTRNLVIIKKSN